jgi:hypothetical protein
LGVTRTQVPLREGPSKGQTAVAHVTDAFRPGFRVQEQRVCRPQTPRRLRTSG